MIAAGLSWSTAGRWVRSDTCVPSSLTGSSGAWCCRAGHGSGASGPAERSGVTVVAAIVWIHDERKLCAGRRHSGAGGRVRMHQACTEVLGQQLDTVCAGSSACDPVPFCCVQFARPARPSADGPREHGSAEPRCPITTPPAAAAKTCLRRRNARLPGFICKRPQITALPALPGDGKGSFPGFHGHCHRGLGMAESAPCP